MSSNLLPRGPAFPRKLEGWKIAAGVGAAIVASPLIGVVLAVLLVSFLPALPLIAPMLSSLWAPQRHRAPRATRPLPSSVHGLPAGLAAGHGAA